MSVFTKKKFSESIDGKGVLIEATANPGTLIHTAINNQSSFDEVWLWVANNDVQNRIITIEWGDATYPEGSVVFTVTPQNGLTMIIPGLIIQNSLEVRAYASLANYLTVYGFINLIS